MMNPIPARPVEELQKVSRNVLCTSYDNCLDLALSKGWQNFSCRNCAAFSPIQKTALDWEEDALRCGALVGIVFYFQSMP